MKHLFTEKYIRGLGNDRKARLEIYDSFCPYLGCRISKNDQSVQTNRESKRGFLRLDTEGIFFLFRPTKTAKKFLV